MRLERVSVENLGGNERLVKLGRQLNGREVGKVMAEFDAFWESMTVCDQVRMVELLVQCVDSRSSGAVFFVCIPLSSDEMSLGEIETESDL